MTVIREYGQFQLNYDEAQRLYNVTNNILIEHTKDKGASYWMNEDDVEHVKLMSDAEFGAYAKRVAGNDIYCDEVIESMITKFKKDGDIVDGVFVKDVTSELGGYIERGHTEEGFREYYKTKHI